MKTKIFSLLLVLGVFVFVPASAQKQISAKLDRATVYFNGAALTHTASATLKSGSQEVIIDGLSPDIVLSSLKVKANGVLISASEFSKDYITPKEETARIKKLNDSLDYYNDLLNDAMNELTIHSQLLKLVTEGTQNNMNQKDHGVAIADITANMELYKTKATELQKSIDKDNKKIEKLEEAVDRLGKQILQDGNASKIRSGVLKLAISVPQNVNTVFTITYVTNKAKWVPCYDLNIPSMDKPIVLQAKAQVQQTTGINWDNVNLTLSTAQPNRSAEAPVFKAWFLQFVHQRIIPGMQVRKNSEGYETMASNTISYEAEGVASVDAMDARLAAPQSMNDYININEQEFMVNYDIAVPYDIPGNGKWQLIDLNNYDIKANFKYYSAPKLSDLTYIVATLSDYGKYNLLPGEATVTFNDTYVGKTWIRPNDTEKEITLTLTTEPRVVVKREKQRDFCSTKHVGNSTTETRSYLITVRNNLTRSAKLTLKEQYPISNDKDIDVKLIEVKPTATYNKEDIGVLTWDMELNAGETRTFVVTYSVKYPKDRTIAW